MTELFDFLRTDAGADSADLAASFDRDERRRGLDAVGRGELAILQRVDRADWIALSLQEADAGLRLKADRAGEPPEVEDLVGCGRRRRGRLRRPIEPNAG